MRAAEMYTTEGIEFLLDEAERLAQQNPRQTRQLTLLCTEWAIALPAPALVPRTLYLRAQTHAIHGEFEAALQLIEQARSAYEDQGRTYDALRTTIGFMNVLTDLSRFQEALDAGQNVLDAIQKHTSVQPSHLTPAPGEAVSADQWQLLTALAHVNRSTALGYLGRYREEADELALAEVIYQRLNLPERIATVSSNRGVNLVYLGLVREALAAFQKAVELRSGSPPSLFQGHTLINIGQAHLLLGNYMESLHTFEQAQALLTMLDAHIDQQINLIHMADAYRVLNLYPEALSMYRDAEQALSATEMKYERAVALWGIGSTLLAQSREAEAHTALTEASTLFAQIGNMSLRVGVLLEIAALQARQGERASALHTAHSALETVTGDVSGNVWPVQQIYAHMRISDLLLPDTVAARPHLEAAEELLTTMALPHLRYRLNQRFGRLHLMEGNDRAAQWRLEQAIQEVEQLRDTLSHEAFRTSFLSDKTAAYEELMLLHLRRNHEESTQEAFAIAERAKSRTLVDRLVGIVAKELDTTLDPESAIRLAMLQADLNAVYSKLLMDDQTGDEAEPHIRAAHVTNLQTYARKVEHEISRIRLRIQTTGNPISGDPFRTSLSAPVIQSQLPGDLALIAYHTIGDEIMAFVFVNGHVRALRNLSSVVCVKRLLQQLHLQWSRLRSVQSLAEHHLPLLEKATQRVLTQLHKELFAPVASLIEQLSANRLDTGTDGQPKLAIVPHGLVHQVPFQALYDGQHYLLERYEISYAPSATVLALCYQRPSRRTEEVLVMGVSEPGIPAVAAEMRAITHYLRSAAVFHNEQATAQTLSDRAGTSSILHLACHGLFRADNPMFSALKLHDRWFTATEMARLDLHGALVVLSACESGRGHVLGGDELLGLARACLGAGASSLIVSHWLVQDDTGAIVMAEFYARLAQGVAPASALRAAQLVLKNSHPHPYHWAPFVFMGNRSRPA